MKYVTLRDEIVVSVHAAPTTETIEAPDNVGLGSVRDGETWSDPPAPVPQSVTPLQARKALRQAGMMDALNTWLATQPEAVTEVWEYALSIERDNPTLAAGAVALDLTDAQVDDLFRLAATL